MKLNKLYNMDVREGLNRMFEDGLQVDCIITSPPYWSLRDYGIPPSIWDGDPECDHDFDLQNVNGEGYTSSKRWQHGKSRNSNPEGWSIDISKHGFCLKCGAWKGTLGLEPTIELYIKHLCDIYDLTRQVLKKSGTNWVNLGDTYSAGGRSGSKKYFEKGHKQFGKNDPQGRYQAPKKVEGMSAKCLCLIPFRFAIEMINRGWILRNVIIWHKSNCMPSSAKDRFTIDFEYIFFFVKSNKNQYWINEKTAQLTSKKPLGKKGVENIDWEWRECHKCLGTGISHKKCSFCDENSGWYYDKLLRPNICPKCKGKGKIKQDKECKACKGKGIKKHNFWRGRQYWFEQQREPLSDNPSTRERYKYKVGDQTNRKDIGIDMVKPGQPFNQYFPQDLPQEQDFPILKYTENEITEVTKQKSGWQKERDKGINNRAKYQSREWNEWMQEVPLISNPLGKNKRTVWTIPTHSNPESHFATFPPKLVEPMIRSGCPKYVCKVCEKPREKIIKSKGIPRNRQIGKQVHKRINSPDGRGDLSGNKLKEWKEKNPDKILGFTDCGCEFDNIKYSKAGLNLSNTSTILTKKVFPQEFKGFTDCNHGSKWKPGVVLDPFAGTGTTLYQAWKLGRNFIGFEISKEYCQIAEKSLKQCKNVRLDKFIFERIKEVE